MIYHVTSQVSGGATASLRGGAGVERRNAPLIGRLLLAAALVLVVPACSDGEGADPASTLASRSAAPGSAPTSAPDVTGVVSLRWEDLPPVPLSAGRSQLTIVAGGDRYLFVLGGVLGDVSSAVFPGDGAYFDASTSEWSAMPDPPFPLLANTTATWSGAELVVLSAGYDAPVLASFDPETATWRTVVLGDQTVAPAYLGAHDDTVVLYGMPGRVYDSQAVLTVDLASGAVAELARSPLDSLMQPWSVLVRDGVAIVAGISVTTGVGQIAVLDLAASSWTGPFETDGALSALLPAGDGHSTAVILAPDGTRTLADFDPATGTLSEPGVPFAIEDELYAVAYGSTGVGVVAVGGFSAETDDWVDVVEVVGPDGALALPPVPGGPAECVVAPSRIWCIDPASMAVVALPLHRP